MQRVDSTQQLTFIEPEGNRVIGLTRSGRPHGLLPGEHDREAIQVGDHSAIHRFVKRKQSRLVCEQLADGDLLFLMLCELGPVPGHPLFIIEQPREWASASVIAARPFVAECITTMVSCSQGSRVCLFLMPPHKSTTFWPR